MYLDDQQCIKANLPPDARCLPHMLIHFNTSHTMPWWSWLQWTCQHPSKAATSTIKMTFMFFLRMADDNFTKFAHDCIIPYWHYICFTHASGRSFFTPKVYVNSKAQKWHNDGLLSPWMTFVMRYMWWITYTTWYGRMMFHSSITGTSPYVF